MPIGLLLFSDLCSYCFFLLLFIFNHRLFNLGMFHILPLRSSKAIHGPSHGTTDGGCHIHFLWTLPLPPSNGTLTAASKDNPFASRNQSDRLASPVKVSCSPDSASSTSGSPIALPDFYLRIWCLLQGSSLVNCELQSPCVRPWEVPLCFCFQSPAGEGISDHKMMWVIPQNIIQFIIG